jgi:hypothetical protein
MNRFQMGRGSGQDREMNRGDFSEAEARQRMRGPVPPHQQHAGPGYGPNEPRLMGQRPEYYEEEAGFEGEYDPRYGAPQPHDPRAIDPRAMDPRAMHDPRSMHDPRVAHDPRQQSPFTRSNMLSRRGDQAQQQARFQQAPRQWQEGEGYYENYPRDNERFVEKSSPLRFIFAITGLVVIAGISWFSYRWATSSQSEPPVIQAEQGPFKVRPENPGGMSIPHQDKLIYGRLTPNSEQPVERLLPQEQNNNGSTPSGYPQDAAGQQQGQQQAPQQQGGPVEPQVVDPSQQPLMIQQNNQMQGYAPQTQGNSPQEGRPNSSQYSTTPENEETYLEAPKKGVKSESKPNAPQANTQDAKKREAAAAIAAEKAAAAAPEKTSAQGGTFFLQMATLPSEGMAQREGDRLKRKYSNQLGGAKVQVRSFDMPDGRKYRVMAGPFKTKAAASTKCTDIGGNCRVVNIGG